MQQIRLKPRDPNMTNEHRQVKDIKHAQNLGCRTYHVRSQGEDCKAINSREVPIFSLLTRKLLLARVAKQTQKQSKLT